MIPIIILTSSIIALPIIEFPNIVTPIIAFPIFVMPIIRTYVLLSRASKVATLNGSEEPGGVGLPVTGVAKPFTRFFVKGSSERRVRQHPIESEH